MGMYRGISIEAKNLLVEDLEHMKQKDPGKDAPLQVLNKDDLKELIGRSTDVGDMCMMRMMFELKKPMAFGFIPTRPGPSDKEVKKDKKEIKEEKEEFKKQIEEGKVAMAPVIR